VRGALLLVSLVVLVAGACSSGNGAKNETEGGATPAATDARPELGVDPPPTASEPPAAAPRPDEVTAPGAEDEADAVAVVRAWSTALNADDNESAGELFAPDAIVIQGPNAVPLPDLSTAVRFNASLPCSGQIVDVMVSGNVVTAVFELGHRAASQCDAPPGTLAAADIVVEGGSIVLWQSVPVPDRRDSSSSAV